MDFDPSPRPGGDVTSLGVNRGVVFWEDGADAANPRRTGQRLYALDAGPARHPGFGTKGSVDLKEGLGRDVSNLYVLSNTPGAIYKDLLILGTRGLGGTGPGRARTRPRLRRPHRQDPMDSPHHPAARRAGYDTWPPDA